MVIIASTKKPSTGKPRKRAYRIMFLAGLVVIGTALCLWGALGALLLPGIFFLIPLFMYINDQREVLPFTAWVDNGILYFDYYTKDVNNNRQRHALSFLPESIRSYTVHSFLKGAPAFLEIEFDTGNAAGRSKPIYMEELSREEAGKLLAFLDSLMVRRKKLEEAGRQRRLE